MLEAASESKSAPMRLQFYSIEETADIEENAETLE